MRRVGHHSRLHYPSRHVCVKCVKQFPITPDYSITLSSLTFVADQDGEGLLAVLLRVQGYAVPILQIRKAIHVGDIVTEQNSLH